MSKILEMAQQLGEEIAKSPEFLAYREAEVSFLSDEEAQAKMNECEKEREEISERARNTEMTPETLKAFQDEIRASMDKLMENATAKVYLETKSEFSSLINQVNQIISYCIKGEEGGGCGGNCSGCSGCH